MAPRFVESLAFPLSVSYPLLVLEALSRYLKELDMQTTTITPDSLHSGTERVVGFTLSEDSSAAASITFRAGAAGGTVIVGPINLAADESAHIILPKAVFYEFPGGCYVKEESGSIAGQLYTP